MDKRQLKALGKKLTARCRELQAAVQRNLSDGRASDRAADLGDIANTGFEKEIAFGRNASVSQHLKLSQEALRRIEDGTFGYCTLCQDEISPQRLVAVPWTRYCIGCQEQLERSRI